PGVVAAAPPTSVAAAPRAVEAGGPAMPAPAPVAERTIAVVSPMVGTFYRAPAPDADPYVEGGDLVGVGQTGCIVQALKLMNGIQSEVKGRVVRILVENAQAVEFGQPLFQIDPS